MPVHDWTRVDAGLFRSFHLSWVAALAGRLNTGGLPPGYYALVQPGEGTVEDFPLFGREGGLSDAEIARRRRQTVAVRREADDGTVALVEVGAPVLNEDAAGLRAFCHKVRTAVDHGVGVLVVDLFPPGPRAPAGLHGAVWEALAGERYTPPAGKPLTVAAYEPATPATADIDPVAVGDPLPDAPLFVAPGRYVRVPLEAAYRTAWAGFPLRLRQVVAPDDWAGGSGPGGAT